MQYRLTLPMMVLAFRDNHQAAVTIPAGTLIEVAGPVEDDDRFLLINAGDAQFHIFASDLADQAKAVVSRETAPDSGRKGPSSESKPKRGARRPAVA